jgi:CheY-like chemotaxis protein
MSADKKVKIILLADDDPDDAEIFTTVFSEVDQTVVVHSFFAGAGLFDYLRQPSNPRPSAIFLDINMPELSGWQCLSALKGDPATKDIPVVMYSTSSHHRDKQKATELGAAGFITKPSDLKTLRTILSTVAANLHTDFGKAIHNLR